jgi:hypothetical protein
MNAASVANPVAPSSPLNIRLLALAAFGSFNIRTSRLSVGLQLLRVSQNLLGTSQDP